MSYQYEIPNSQLLLSRTQPYSAIGREYFQLDDLSPSANESLYAYISEYAVSQRKKTNNKLKRRSRCRCCWISFSLFLITLAITSLVLCYLYLYHLPLSTWIQPLSIDYLTGKVSATNETLCDDPDYEYFEETDHCYKVYLSAVLFEEAKASCESEEAHLTSIHSPAENKFLNYLYNTQLASYNKKAKEPEQRRNVWIGLVFLDKQWVWTDGSPMDFDYWATGEPNHLDKNEYWTEMVVHNEPYNTYADAWNNISPLNELGYFCKKPAHNANRKFTTIAGPVVKPVECSPGYELLEQTSYCYKIFESKSTIHQAHACMSDGAHLASIHSVLENRLLADMFRKRSETHPASSYARKLSEKNEVLIGLVYEKGGWHWSDGTTVKFTNWAPGEPNQPNVKQAAVLITTKIAELNPDGDRWASVASDSVQGLYLCRKPARTDLNNLLIADL